MFCHIAAATSSSRLAQIWAVESHSLTAVEVSKIRRFLLDSLGGTRDEAIGFDLEFFQINDSITGSHMTGIGKYSYSA